MNFRDIELDNFLISGDRSDFIPDNCGEEQEIFDEEYEYVD